jgi:hypothetical protein
MSRTSVLDLFCGLKGWSAAFTDCDVETLDIEARFNPTYCMDVRDFHPKHYDLVLASPPCQEYSKWNMRCFYPNPPIPDETLWNEALRVIAEATPMYWVVENVQGARLFHPGCVMHCGPRYLWGNFPLFPPFKTTKGYVASRNGKGGVPTYRNPALKAEIPYKLSKAMHDAMTEHPQ